ncbi:hypothetical protein C7M84_010048 [Penaeus vannamei]|uniref:Uncharacterized protein n=1 Tax=Penaeus vannamei TaxID=6689 RepID=A0A423T5H3_PENVA|nr:hypothetical protein C7M84_010048 [Penaeus vannamei]
MIETSCILIGLWMLRLCSRLIYLCIHLTNIRLSSYPNLHLSNHYAIHLSIHPNAIHPPANCQQFHTPIHSSNCHLIHLSIYRTVIPLAYPFNQLSSHPLIHSPFHLPIHSPNCYLIYLSIYRTVIPFIYPSIQRPSHLPINLSISHYIYLSIRHSIYLSIYPTVTSSVYPSVIPSTYPSNYPLIHIFIHPSNSHLIRISPTTHPTVTSTVYPPAIPSTYSSIHPTVTSSVYPSTYPSNYHFIHLSIHPTVTSSVYPSTYPSNCHHNRLSTRHPIHFPAILSKPSSDYNLLSALPNFSHFLPSLRHFSASTRIPLSSHSFVMLERHLLDVVVDGGNGTWETDCLPSGPLPARRPRPRVRPVMLASMAAMLWLLLQSIFSCSCSLSE